MARAAIIALLLAASAAGAAGASWPGADSAAQVWGVNYRLTEPKPGEFAMMAAAGVRYARIELPWAATEPRAGEFDFAPALELADALIAHGIRPWFVLGGTHLAHAPDPGIGTEAGRALFARWAAAAAAALRGRGAIWEIWNEPNNPRYWQPRPEPAAYAALALAATRAIRAADPSATVVGPAVNQVDLSFLRVCGGAGLFALWDGVTVHPYRRSAPESALPELRAARALLLAAGPPARAPALLISEWGYSTVWVDDETQAACAARVWLTVLAAGVPAVAWFEWRDAGDDPQNPEHHYGLVGYAYREGQVQPYAPKLSYQAAATLVRELRGYRLNKSLVHDSGRARLLVLERAPDAPAGTPPLKLIVWNTGVAGLESVTLPVGPGAFRRLDALGRAQPEITAGGPALALELGLQPVILTPVTPADRLLLLAAWPRWPREFAAPRLSAVAASMTWSNPLGRAVRFTPALDPPPATPPPGADFSLAPGGAITLTSAPLPAPAPDAPRRLRAGIEGWWQESWLEAPRPPELAITPLRADDLTVSAPDTPGGQLAVRAGGLDFSAKAAPGAIPEVKVPANLLLARANTFLTAALADAAGAKLADQVFGRVERLPLPTGRPGSPGGLRAAPENPLPGGGDAACVWAEPPDAAAAPAPLALRVDYNFARGGRYFRFVPGAAAPLPVWPRRIGFWVYGDEPALLLTVRVRDSSGQVFQPPPALVQGAGWRAVWLDLDPAVCLHWDGQNDGAPRAPLAWDCYFMIERIDQAPAQGALYLTAPTLVFPPE